MTHHVLRDILHQSRIIAVVGLSSDPTRASYDVARYMQQHGYKIVPINPNESHILDEPAYPDLLSVPFAIDIVNIFRRSEAVGPHVDEAIARDIPIIWMQLGIRNVEAARRARDHGIQVVMDRCIKVDHMRLVRQSTGWMMQDIWHDA